jgi:hypothetical protein
MAVATQGQRQHGRLRAIVSSERAPLVVLGAWVVLVSGILARFGVPNRYVFRDEANAINFGREIAHDLSQSLAGSVGRGPERMTSLFAAAAAELTGDPVRQVELLHLWAAACEGLVAVPVWLAARTLGLGRWQALVPATVASAGSFAYFGIFTLNAAVGTLTAALLLWAMVRALARPSLASDLFVVVALALLGLARIGWAPLVVALVPAVLATTWLERPDGEGPRRWLAALPRRLARRHPLLTALALLLLAFALVAGPSALLGGGYGGVRLHAHIVPSVLWHNTRVLATHLAIGVALVPVVLALPMLSRGLVRPATAREGGFAWLVLGMTLAFSYAYYASMNEDRYFAVLVAPLVLAAAVAVFLRPPPLWSVLLSGALVVALLATTYDAPARGPFAYFTDPTSRFFADVVVGRLTQHLPGSGALWAALVAAAAVAGAVLALSATRGGGLGRVGAVLVLAGLLVCQLAALYHPAMKFTELLGMRGVTADQLELVDRAADGAPARVLAVDGILDPDLEAQLPLLTAYNVTLDPLPLAISSKLGAAGRRSGHAWIEPRRGRITAPDPPAVVLQVGGAAQVGIAGVARPPSALFPWARLVRPAVPFRAEWTISGATASRYARPGVPVRIHAFPTQAPHRCLSGLLFAHPLADGTVRFQLRDGRRERTGVLRPTVPRPFSALLSATRPLVVTLTGQARTLPTGERVGPTVSDLAVGPCASR